MPLTRTQVRALAGLAAGLATGIGLLVWVSAEGLHQERAARADRLAVLRTRMVADLVERTGGFDDAARSAVARVAASDPDIVSARLVRLDGARLEASTVADDAGDRAPPRRLERSEKWLYDLGQEIQAARATNVEEGSARKPEILLARESDGRRRIAAPIELDGQGAGLVHVEILDPGAPGAVPVTAAAVALLLPVLLFLPVCRLAGDRQARLAAASALLLAGALGAFSWVTTRTLVEARRQTARDIVDLARAQLAVAQAGRPADDAPFDVSRWDVDPFRRPIGLVGADDRLVPATLEGDAARTQGWALRRALPITALALLVLLAVALGLAERTGTTILRHRVAYTYAAPALGGLLLLVFLPFLYGFVLSFTGANIYNSNAPISEIWVGLHNFHDILTDVAIRQGSGAERVFNYQNFYWTLGFTVVWTVTNVAIGVSVGIALALALNTPGLALRPFYRVLLIMPWAVPNYITALIWRGMFHKQFGVINQALLILGGDSISWFEHPLTSFTAIVATNGWLSFPFMMVISLGSLQSIPGELYEAARVDGATRLQQFRSITLPSLKPALVPAVILSVIWTFNMFNIPYLVSAGEPAHATEILITQAYKIAFEQYRYGYAAAYSMIIFVILLAYGTWQNRVSRATEAL